jgi:hypothetical protein
MTDNEHPFDLVAAQEAVQGDISGVFGSFLDGKPAIDEQIGEATWRTETSEFFAVRWRFEGRHVGRIPGFGHTFIEPTHNMVSVSGLTLVENTKVGQLVTGDLEPLLRGGTIVFHRFLDWMAVFAQIGVLHLGRPMSISEITFGPQNPGTSRLPGYNDQQEG